MGEFTQCTKSIYCQINNKSSQPTTNCLVDVVELENLLVELLQLADGYLGHLPVVRVEPVQFGLHVGGLGHDGSGVAVA